MLPFKVVFKPGISVHQQAVYAAKKAVVSGRLRPGDLFPSVRALSQELKINPNTAHKVVVELTRQGMLEVRPGLGTVIAETAPASKQQRTALLENELEQLVVESKRLMIDLDELIEVLAEHWRRLSPRAPKTEPEKVVAKEIP